MKSTAYPYTDQIKPAAGDAATDGKTPNPVANRSSPRRRFCIRKGDFPEAACGVRDILSEAGNIFQRGNTPARIVELGDGSLPLIEELTINVVVNEVHRFVQPVLINPPSKPRLVTLPDKVAALYLAMTGEWGVPPIAGITTSPILHADGTIRVASGYDAETRLYCRGVPDVARLVPENPTLEEAANALQLIRKTFCTFPFADAAMISDATLGLEIVDLSQPPAFDESAFLNALLTAVCRASVKLAPGVVITAPGVSGAGNAKGLAIRGMSIIAFGVEPAPFTMGHDRNELDKRIVAELIDGRPVLFLDNLNGITLKSMTLASVLTERPARVRVLGESRNVTLDSAAFVAITGNGLLISEDLVRRLLHVHLDAKCENPELRPFRGSFLHDTIIPQRSQLLAAALTILRFGRMNSGELARGRMLGSYSDFCSWVRDPLVTLGCADPVEMISQAKQNDPERQRIIDFLGAWYERHGNACLQQSEIDQYVIERIDPQGRSRQFVNAELQKLVDTRIGGFVLTSQTPSGNWGRTTYQVTKVAKAEER